MSDYSLAVERSEEVDCLISDVKHSLKCKLEFSSASVVFKNTFLRTEVFKLRDKQSLMWRIYLFIVGAYFVKSIWSVIIGRWLEVIGLSRGVLGDR